MKTITISDDAYEELRSFFAPKKKRECVCESSDDWLTIEIGPESMNELRYAHPGLFFGKKGKSWYDEEPFADERGEEGTMTLRKSALPGSFSKTWEEQAESLPDDERVPTARELAHAIVGHFLETGQRLFEKTYVRTSSVDSDGDRVLLGGFDADGLRVNGYWGSDRVDFLGVAACRKTETS